MEEVVSAVLRIVNSELGIFDEFRNTEEITEAILTTNRFSLFMEAKSLSNGELQRENEF